MQAKLEADGIPDLYGYWGDRLYGELVKESRTIVNLASKEYSRAVEPYLADQDVFITCVFGTMINGKIKVKATEARWPVALWSAGWRSMKSKMQNV
ncbi:peroxide stress protein YaaA [Clostridium sp. AM58-1XD]|uniref:peroxide stress protein YaaA n=1 Tax=Clostridium sp. AM58-1XD TaxID=2292307 RepID=UPI00325A8083